MLSILKKLKSIVALGLVMALIITLVPVNNVYAAKNPSIKGDTYIVDKEIIPDTELLNALIQIIGQGKDFTFKQFKEYTGEIDLSSYTNITEVTGLGFARKASSINLKNLTKVKKIADFEFQECTFTEFQLPTQLEEIGQDAFASCVNLTTVDFPETLTKIKDNAFSSCNSLDNIVLPKGIKLIGGAAFMHCSSLREIVIPDGLNGSTETNQDSSGIGSNVFYGCTSLTSIVLPKDMTTIPAGLLQGTRSLTAVEVPATVSDIKDSAFQESAILQIDLSKNTKLKEINDNVFTNCYYLYSVKLPSSIESIGSNAFANCYDLPNTDFLSNLSKLKTIDYYAFKESGVSKVLIPENVETIGLGAFQECKSLQSVEIRDFSVSLTSQKTKLIGMNAFASCEALETVVLPTKNENNINMNLEIEERAFSSCSKLSNINYPLSLRKIGNYAFEKCSSERTYQESICRALVKYISIENVSKTAKNGYEKVKAALPTNEAYYSFEEIYVNLAALKDTAQTGLETIWIEDTAGTMNAFEQYIYGQKVVDLSKNIGLEIGEGAFSSCYSIEEFHFPSDMYTTPKAVLQNCSIERKAYDNVTFANKKVYSTDIECYKGVREVYFGDKIEKISEASFYNCANLQIGDTSLYGLKEIGVNAFALCRYIGSIKLPDTVEVIDNNAFMNCSRTNNQGHTIEGSGLSDIDFSAASNLRKIGNNAFQNTSITTAMMNLEAPLRTISAATFYNCEYLLRVRVPDAVEAIESQAFGVCPALEALSVPDIAVLHHYVVMGNKRVSDSTTAISTNYFGITIRKSNEKLTAKCNSEYEIPLYTVVANQYSKISEITIGDKKYVVDDTGLDFTTPIEGNIKPVIKTKNYTTERGTYTIYVVNIIGINEEENVPVQIQMALRYEMEAGTGTVINYNPLISYSVDITANPCQKIEATEKYYISKDANKNTMVEIAPAFTGLDGTNDITDVVEWKVATNEENIELIVAEDGKSAKVVSKNNGYGVSRIDIKAGKVTKSVYVYVTAPAYRVTLSKSSDALLLNQTNTVTAKLSYYDNYVSVSDSYPDNVSCVSSDESIVKVKSVNVTQNGTVFTYQGISMGEATLRFTADSGKTWVDYKVSVSSEGLEISLKNSDKSSVANNATVSFTGRNTITYNYDFNETVSNNEIKWIVENADVVDVSNNVASKTVSITTKGYGKTKVVLYPACGTPSANGITLYINSNARVNGIWLKGKVLKTGESGSVFDSMTNEFNQKIDSASDNNYTSITNQRITFESSDDKLVSVDNYGNVSAKAIYNSASRSAVITCKVWNGNELYKSAACSVTVEYPAVTQISAGSSYSITVGKSIVIPYSFYPDSANPESIAIGIEGAKGIVISSVLDKTNKQIKVTANTPGTNTLTIKSGDTVKKISIKVTKPTVGKPKIKIKKGKKFLKLSWKKVKGAKGFQIAVGNKKKGPFTIITVNKNKKKNKKTIKNLARKTKYYVKVRGFVVVGNQTYYGKWSKVKKVKTK